MSLREEIIEYHTYVDMGLCNFDVGRQWFANSNPFRIRMQITWTYEVVGY